MSSKGKSMVATSGGAALLPERRFPDFHTAGAWQNVALGSVASITAKKVGDKKCVPMSITSGVGLVSQMEKFGRIIAGDSYRNYLQLQRNDFAYNKSATKEYPEGFIALYTGDEVAAVPNSIFTCFRIQEDVISPSYLNYLFLGNLHGRWLRKFIEVGARAHGSLSINDRDLLALPVPVPSGPNSLSEQHKIADCLNSADALIAAQGRKVEALKAHKTGLMQQLFPQEGETQPRLRFPEFQKAPSWEPTTIGDLGSFYYGKSAPKWSLAPDAPTPCVRYGELYSTFGPVITETYSRTNIDPGTLRFSKGGEILVPRVGEKPEDFGKCCCYLPLANIAIGEMISVFETDQDPLFYTYYFRKLYRQFAKVVEGQNVKNLYYVELEPIPLFRPSIQEQVRIAGCLRSVDDVIAAETRKLDTLKVHKKALRQQLFPFVGEVDA